MISSSILYFSALLVNHSLLFRASIYKIKTGSFIKSQNLYLFSSFHIRYVVDFHLKLDQCNCFDVLLCFALCISLRVWCGYSIYIRKSIRQRKIAALKKTLELHTTCCIIAFLDQCFSFSGCTQLHFISRFVYVSNENIIKIE